MGLDMYLDRKQTFGGFGKEIKEAKIIDKEGNEQTIEPDRYGSVEVSKTIAYWRKANQIHNWFIENCGDGEDDCRPIPVGIDQLKELLQLCKEVREKAKMGIGLIQIFSGCSNLNDTYRKATPIYDENGSIAALTTDDEIVEGDLLMIGDFFVVETGNLEKESNGKTIFYKITGTGEYRAYVFGETITNAEEIADLLPTTEGFFFGSTDYDEYYLDDINNTIEQLDNIIADHEEMVDDGVKEYNLHYYYIASW